MTSPTDPPPPLNPPRRSRLALASVVLAACVPVVYCGGMFPLMHYARNLQGTQPNQLYIKLLLIPSCFTYLIVPLAIILGIAALVAIRRSNGQLVGRGMAIVGISLGGSYIVLFVLMICLALAMAGGSGQRPAS
jgi:Domain of unknown function (DUF4190)